VSWERAIEVSDERNGSVVDDKKFDVRKSRDKLWKEKKKTRVREMNVRRRSSRALTAALFSASRGE
jgi:hypothetical protein